MARSAFEKLEVYRLSERLADAVWNIVLAWDPYSKDTVGRQLVRATDSIGANIAEGFGRGSHADHRRFIRVAHGSMYETMHWLRRTYARSLVADDQVRTLKPLLDELAPRLNAYLNSIGSARRQSLEDRPSSEPSDG